jgi:hypothetical protein
LQVATEADLGLADAYINGYCSFVDKKQGLLNLLLVIKSTIIIPLIAYLLHLKLYTQLQHPSAFYLFLSMQSELKWSMFIFLAADSDC